MVSVLISFSRITLLAFVLAFTFIDIIQIFEFKNSEVFGSVMSTIQSVMVVLFLCNTSIILYLVREDSIYLFLLAGQLLLFALIGISLNKLTYPMSRALINNMLFFLTLSFAFLERLSQGRAIRQFVFAIVSLIISIIVIMILRQIKRIESFMYVFAAIGIILLLIVSLAGKVEYGAKLSLSFGNISIQPSEFVKLSFLFYLHFSYFFLL